ncbi:MAG: sulfurtransferase [Rhodospirillaceae bacterium]|nr:sulfurtransferase [Rhodospirillaceae bacterium]
MKKHKNIFRTYLCLAIVLSVSILGGRMAIAADPLVDVRWLTANAGKPEVVIIDTRIQSTYSSSHIPGAVSSGYVKSGWRMFKNGVFGVFPDDPSKLAIHIGSLGIDSNTHVVLVAAGRSSADMAIAARVYWSFKVLGHDKVSILNGGMQAYQAELDAQGKPANPLVESATIAETKVFGFALRKDMLVNEEDVKSAQDRGVTLVDSRTSDQYLGVNRHKKAKASGTIPGAKNIPYTWLMVNGGGLFRSKNNMEVLYSAAGVPLNGEHIYFGNTGDLAAVGWFVSYEMFGNKKAKMYDGSVIAWTAKDLPVEQKIKITD